MLPNKPLKTTSTECCARLELATVWRLSICAERKAWWPDRYGPILLHSDCQYVISRRCDTISPYCSLSTPFQGSEYPTATHPTLNLQYRNQIVTKLLLATI